MSQAQSNAQLDALDFNDDEEEEQEDDGKWQHIDRLASLNIGE